MASPGNAALVATGNLKLNGPVNVVIVKTEWNSDIINELEAGALRILKANGIKAETITVPGAVEITFAIKAHASSANAADAYIALGCVIKGDTPHFDYVCQSVTHGITELNLAYYHSPVIMGILTVNTHEQALERTGGIHGHKGEEAAITALKMVSLYRSFDNSEVSGQHDF